MIFSLLIGVALADKHKYRTNPEGPLRMELAWQQEMIYNWDEVDHVAAFKNWATHFDKHYEDLNEESKAFLTFLENWQMINDFNLNGEDESYTLRMNQFGDLKGDALREYVHGHTGSCMRHRTPRERVQLREVVPQVDAPDSIDWTDYNGKSYVTAVKNQGQCGSCWAFSTTGSIESRTAIKNGETGSSITTLSEQQLVDCSRSYGNMGCSGGLMDDAFKYVEAAGGLCSEEEYPYTAKDGKTCEVSKCKTLYSPITDYSDVRSDDESALMAAVAEGPVSIAIEADQSAFQFYSSGVLTGKCGTRLDHGVLVVGYGQDGDDKFWKVKNSWGTSWGEEGYVRLCRECDANGKAGECGILEEPSFPTAK